MIPLTVSQQYVLASKARSKLMKCANAGKNKDFDLRVLVGHANMLDRLMDSIEKFNSKDRDAGSYGVEYISSDEDSDEENRELSTDSSEEDEADSDSDSSDEEDVGGMLRRARATQLGAVVTVTIDQCLEEQDEYDSDSESDVDEHGFEMDLSMMPLAFKTRDSHIAIHEPIIV